MGNSPPPIVTYVQTYDRTMFCFPSLPRRLVSVIPATVIPFVFLRKNQLFIMWIKHFGSIDMLIFLHGIFPRSNSVFLSWHCMILYKMGHQSNSLQLTSLEGKSTKFVHTRWGKLKTCFIQVWLLVAGNDTSGKRNIQKINVCILEMCYVLHETESVI